MISEEDFFGQDEWEELEEDLYRDGYELEEIQETMQKFCKKIQQIYAERNFNEVVKYLKFQMDYKRDNYVYFGEPRLPKSSNPDEEFYEAKKFLNSKGFLLVEKVLEEGSYNILNKVKNDIEIDNFTKSINAEGILLNVHFELDKDIYEKEKDKAIKHYCDYFIKQMESGTTYDSETKSYKPNTFESVVKWYDDTRVFTGFDLKALQNKSNLYIVRYYDCFAPKSMKDVEAYKLTKTKSSKTTDFITYKKLKDYDTPETFLSFLAHKDRVGLNKIYTNYVGKLPPKIDIKTNHHEGWEEVHKYKGVTDPAFLKHFNSIIAKNIKSYRNSNDPEHDLFDDDLEIYFKNKGKTTLECVILADLTEKAYGDSYSKKYDNPIFERGAIFKYAGYGKGYRLVKSKMNYKSFFDHLYEWQERSFNKYLEIIEDSYNEAIKGLSINPQVKVWFTENLDVWYD
jgi:hypothetical protein